MNPSNQPISPDASPLSSPSRLRARLSLFLTLPGLLIFMLGARPGLFGLDRSPIVGFVQIAFMTVGLGVVCLGGYIGLTGFWKNGTRTIAADFGSRLVATGYVIAVFSAMADVFGMGSHGYPVLAFFGPWQAAGVQIGEALIAAGFILLLPFQHLARPRTASANDPTR